MEALEEYVDQGRTFDYVINDLTDIPISGSNAHGEFKTLCVKRVILNDGDGDGDGDEDDDVDDDDND